MEAPVMKNTPLAALTFALLLAFGTLAAENEAATVQIAIPNMVCVSCELVIERAVFEIKGVNDIEFDGDAKTALIRFDPALTDIDQILSACSDAGYPATVVEAPSI